MIKCSDIDEFINLIDENKILVYGAGYVAGIFVEALNRHGLEKCIYGFAVTDNIAEQKFMGKFWVKSLNQIDDLENVIVCIATHEVSKKEIETVLIQRRISNYIWIYPFLYTLYMGKPVSEGQWIDIKEIISKNENLYGIAVRWAAIDNYYGRCKNGYYLYKKAMKMHCSNETAEERTRAFIRLIQNWEEYGYNSRCQIAINTEGEIIDGEHRVTLALYHKQQFLRCKIYNVRNIHREKALMTRRILLKGGFTQNDIKRLDETNEYIKHFVKEMLC